MVALSAADLSKWFRDYADAIETSGNSMMVDAMTARHIADTLDAGDRLKSKMLLRLEELENGVVAEQRKWEDRGANHNADVEAGKRKGIKIAKEVVRQA